jgi:hypothetical protein
MLTLCSLVPKSEGGLTPETPDSKSAYLFFDWKANGFTNDTSKELIAFALPHHVDILRRLDGQSSNEVIADHCMHSLHGKGDHHRSIFHVLCSLTKNFSD